jgi:hypothetical protein
MLGTDNSRVLELSQGLAIREQLFLAAGFGGLRAVE